MVRSHMREGDINLNRVHTRQDHLPGSLPAKSPACTDWLRAAADQSKQSRQHAGSVSRSAKTSAGAARKLRRLQILSCEGVEVSATHRAWDCAIFLQEVTQRPSHASCGI
eukprot:TRINITY_DN15891_c0_g2_i3.p3 TRINITY_DN15891_c0_g2~~TRINITY_DN15891_c0_g2_i3.p3  ORF type:complete len:110 (+),score=8.43 TRINITY_DN15891_c0_g2_i3:11-340(+)